MPAPSRDPLRYGLRALEEMAREQASVAPPARVTAEVFDPHPMLQRPAREGAALSLRLFAGTEEDATAFVLGGEDELRLAAIPPRAAALFEAHAAAKATEAEDAMTLGFPLVTFLQQGASRAAPLFSVGGVRARWLVGEVPWQVPLGAREGGPLPIPDGLVLARDDEAAFGLHGGVWHYLFGLDGAALATIGAAAKDGLGALVRAAIAALEAGSEDVDAEASFATSPPTEAELTALCEVATRRAGAGRALRAFPHALLMLPARGDPTSALRTDLRTLADEPPPAKGPLAVFLGAPASAPEDGAVWACGKVPPTPSQLAAARAFEGSRDLVAVCGPPGCGKTALLHHVAAQTVVDCALGKVWTEAPARTIAWPLVVTSTNNAAVDNALAPFVAAPDGALPLALRFGNRRTLAEITAPALALAADVLAGPGTLTLAAARAAFEDLARPVRARLREAAAAKKAQAGRTSRRIALEARATALRALVVRAADRPPPAVRDDVLAEASRVLGEHAEAGARLVALHLDGKSPSIAKACEKWARANEVRAPRIAPGLAALGIATPYGPLDAAAPREDIARQRAAIAAARARVDEARELLGAAGAEDELRAIARELAATDEAAGAPPAPDPALYEAALAVRDAWARTHRAELTKRLAAARGAAGDERVPGRGKPLVHALHELAPLFPVAGSTLLSLRTGFPLEREVIDRLVIDEAAQCAPIYAVPALARARRAMLTGDVAQLPPVYTLDPRADDRAAEGLAADAIAPFRMSASATSSAQAVAEPRARARGTLVEHFRSQPSIVALASRWSGYALDVRTAPRSLAEVSPRLRAPIVTLATEGAGVRMGEGVVNEAEAERAVDFVVGLVEDGVPPADIAVLTPFVGQCVRIERALHERRLLERGGVLVSTVHRLQGGERRVVVFSVTATERRHLRWLAERPHLLHVATSRAQDHLVILVDPAAALREPALQALGELL